ncbi:PQQ-dependent sugar dehydrogenase [Pannonibacter indicus]|uniref:Glucose/arabinose dehydrogenase, beta-propeller fold n=1 Tax=Pannonibacter indicus TaxID=466044 RepID=A0A0K6HYE3_9HYPH|nr:PQQ-dependent sugar dehydrogenase [Pannonibacter indicus]CUA95846.1 Glucose/arabinose dehydrogenase, beta-propeller fold [Pannonibacter indicus]
MPLSRLFPLGLAALMAGAAPAAIAQETVRSKAADFRIVEVATDLEHPWGLAFLPDGRMLVTERPGRLRIVGTGGSLSEPLTGLPEIYDSGQGGLLDVILDPDFASNSTIYFSYSTPVERRGTTRIAKAKLTDTGLEDVTVLFTAATPGSNGRHFGSRLVFGPDGYLYASIGDHGADDTAQDLSLHSGKIIRITTDGAPAPGNPFLGTAGALPEIYTYGNRNPQGMTLTPDGEIWANEHGPRGGDEVNVIKAGLNFGWPETTHGRAYSGLPMGEGPEKEGVTPPIQVYVPSIAPSGMAFYQGDAFKGWQGDLFMGALALTHLNRLDMEDGKIVGEERLLEDKGWRIRDVRTGPDGFLYLLTDAPDGKLVRLEPAG